MRGTACDGCLRGQGVGCEGGSVERCRAGVVGSVVVVESGENTGKCHGASDLEASAGEFRW